MFIVQKIQELLSGKSRNERQIRAINAERWLKDDSLSSALASIRIAAINKWVDSKDPETRERAWLMVHVVDDFVYELRQFVEVETAEQTQDARKALRTSPT